MLPVLDASDGESVHAYPSAGPVGRQVTSHSNQSALHDRVRDWLGRLLIVRDPRQPVETLVRCDDSVLRGDVYDRTGPTSGHLTANDLATEKRAGKTDIQVALPL